MKKLMALLGGVGCVAALQGCMVEPDGGQESVSTLDTTITSSIRITYDWGNGYCAEVSVANNLAVMGNEWKVVLDMKGSTIQPGGNDGKNVWNAKASANSGTVTFIPMSYNSWVAPGQTIAFGFCADGPSWARAAMSGYNMSSTQYDVCETNNGLHPTKAGLAVAMATELGRWKPEVDLYIGRTGMVELTSAGQAMCSANGCKNTKAILNMQDDVFTQVIGQASFNATVYRNDLIASVDRQKNNLDNLARNSPWLLPPAHKLTLVGGPVNLGNGSCGPHFIYKATDLNGNPLTQSQADNLAAALCFYGYGGCGSNPYIAYNSGSSLPGCPSGQKCVAIDPTDTVNTTTNTTSAGTAPTYPYNQAWDPNGTILNTACITTTAKLGKMRSKCSLLPATCGWDYCTPN
jgi:hypothetical protein